MIRVAITGPESSGKTRLASDLSRQYDVDFVPEYAREYLLQLGRKYEQHDLDQIAKAQWQLIQDHQDRKPLIADTEMLVLHTWSTVKYGACSPFIENALLTQEFDLYILCDVDIPWEYDPLREHEHDRDELFHRYYKKLRELKLNFIIVKGTPEERLEQALLAIRLFVGKSKLL
jgi:nicotinamide riboside kinase